MTTTITLAGVTVPRIGLGTNRLEDTPEGIAFLRAALDAGIRHVDTAHLYTGGRSEAAVGAALAAGRPDGVVVATKAGYHDASPAAIATEIGGSLARLRTDVIDLLYLHRPDDDVPIEESVGALVTAREQGKVRHIGVSNVDRAQLERALAVTEIAAVQNHLNLAHRQHLDVLDLCEAHGIPFVPFYPLREETPDLARIAAAHDATPSQVTLAWLLARAPVVLPIPGTLSVDHARENLGALDLVLDDDELAALG